MSKAKPSSEKPARRFCVDLTLQFHSECVGSQFHSAEFILRRARGAKSAKVGKTMLPGIMENRHVSQLKSIQIIANQ